MQNDIEVHADAEDDTILVFKNKADGTEIARFPKSQPTEFMQKANKKPYDVSTVYTFLKYADLPFRDYVKKTRAEKAGLVSTVDRKELLAYLSGEIKESSQVGTGSKAAPVSQAAATVTDSKASDGSDTVGGKRKLAETGGDEKTGAKRHAQGIDEGVATKGATGDAGSKVDSAGRGDSTIPKGSSTEQDATKMSEIDLILQQEIEQENRTSVLNNTKKSFASVLALYEKSCNSAKSKRGSKGANAAPNTIAKTSAPRLSLSQLVSKKLHGKNPIIVVPAGTSDLFSMLNIKEFLEKGKYVSARDQKKNGVRKPANLELRRAVDQSGMKESVDASGNPANDSKSKDGSSKDELTFKIVDNVSRLSSRDWPRVVAVLVNGQPWQFKGWKYQFPVEVFSKVQGVYIYMTGDTERGEVVKQWNVKQLEIHPTKRHLDKLTAKSFWDLVIQHVARTFS